MNENPQQYYGESLPAQFNQLLAEQEASAAGDEDARRVLESMKAVDATLKVEVTGEGGGVFFLNLTEGAMNSDGTPTHDPFMAMIQDIGGFEKLVHEAGDSVLGMLGSLSGLAEGMKLTQARIDNLAGVSGSLEFSITGDDGFSLRLHFGLDPVPEEPTTTIRVDRPGYEKLRSGEVAPHEAFMGGLIQVEGDMQLAMQLALAALSPD
jgi:putative sterol carrier protein